MTIYIEVSEYTSNGPGTAFTKKLVNAESIEQVDKSFYSVHGLEFTKLTLHNGKELNIAESYDSF